MNRVLTHPEDVEVVFKDSNKHLKAVNNNSGWLMGELLGQCMGLISGTEWQNVRNAAAVPFSHKSTARYIEQIVQATEEHFLELYQKGRLRQNLINPVDDLRLLPFWVIARILYGELTEELKKDLQEIIEMRESLFKRMVQGGVTRFSWSQCFRTKTNEGLKKFKKRWAEFNDAAYFGCRLAKEETPITRMHEAAEDGKITTQQLHQTLDEMLFANLDVTIGGISWNLLFLADNQDVQADIREEIRSMRILGDIKKRDEYLLSSSTLLAAAVLESARLKPLAAFSVPQSAPTTRVVGGFRVPAGTDFIVDTLALNIRNPYWGDDTDVYRPSRFLHRKRSEMRYQYWRFGFGPRLCLGRDVADLIIRVLLLHLIENYQVRLSQTSHWDRNPGTWIIQPDVEIRCDYLQCLGGGGGGGHRNGAE